MTTSSTSSLLPANSPTTNLPLATTTNLPPATSSTSHLLPSISTARVCNINEADLFVVLVVGEENLLIEAEIEELDVKINTPRPSLYLHNETPGGPTYWEPNVDEPYLPLEGKRFDTIEECVEFYSVYAEKEVLKLKNRHKRKLKVVWLNQKYKNLTKKQRKMPQAEKMFIVKVSTIRLGATKAHNLYSKMKGGTQYVHGTSDDFKNHIRDVNAFIGESDAQMLINKMENRKKFVPNFTFHYLVENNELVAMFWADEVAKCNYKEFGDII
nr:hypothetical protein [Tanacetum cinerariifolium]